jgi:hypothetical protein
MSLSVLWHCLKAVVRFRDYRPQPVTRKSFMTWINQYSQSGDKKHILAALDRITYLTEEETRKTLVHLNNALLKNLHEAGVPPEKIIYVQFHDAGSSSPVMLNLLRDATQLDRRGCHLVDANNQLELYKATNQIGEGVIVYVDDFVGTGNQFFEVREGISPQIIGTFTEYLLVVAICEEGIHALSKMGIETVKRFVDLKANRPLHPFCSRLTPAVRARLEELCLDIDPNLGLGYHQLASMTVLYRNAPDTFPLLFRGSANQYPKLGLLPRAQDLPITDLG